VPGEVEGHAEDCGVTAGGFRGDTGLIWDLVRAH
jgi:hypothetical protein